MYRLYHTKVMVYHNSWYGNCNELFNTIKYGWYAVLNEMFGNCTEPTPNSAQGNGCGWTGSVDILTRMNFFYSSF